MPERLLKKEAIQRLAAVSGADPVAELFKHITRSALVFRFTEKPQSEDYTVNPDFLLEARTYTLGGFVSVEFSVTQLRYTLVYKRPVTAMRFVNGHPFAAVHHLGLNPLKLDENEWQLHSTIGPGLVLTRHARTVGSYPDLEKGLGEAISSHRFIYPGYPGKRSA